MLLISRCLARLLTLWWKRRNQDQFVSLDYLKGRVWGQGDTEV